MERGQIAVRFHRPPPDLERYFTTFYCVDLAPPDGSVFVDALHPEWANIRMFLGSRPDTRIGDYHVTDADITVSGPSSTISPFELGATTLWGIGLLPLGWAEFVGEPADKYANGLFDARGHEVFQRFAVLADSVQATRGEEEQLAAIVRYFREEAPRADKLDPRIQTIHAVLVEPELPHVSELADRCDLNQRTLERLCRRYFGFSPKMLLRRQRFMRSLAQFMLDPSMGWIGALDSLYFDQSHFVRDCKTFLGMAPSEYAAQDHPVMAAFLRERHRLFGSAVQTLDQPD